MRSGKWGWWSECLSKVRGSEGRYEKCSVGGNGRKSVKAEIEMEGFVGGWKDYQKAWCASTRWMQPTQAAWATLQLKVICIIRRSSSSRNPHTSLLTRTAVTPAAVGASSWRGGEQQLQRAGTVIVLSLESSGSSGQWLGCYLPYINIEHNVPMPISD